MDNILEVKRLKISFRTNNGTVKAVRDISFDLHRGETLAIVGESGSGKSVTSKAILGISAGNAIIDSGEILYDGKDLLKISEEEMYKLRGDKIAMIFQDPLSSLDPIVKIGQQIIEALILKNRESRKSSRKEFNTMLAILKANMIEAIGEDQKDKISTMIKTFDNFNIHSLQLENHYNVANTRAEETISLIETFLFNHSRKQKVDTLMTLHACATKLKEINDKYFINGFKDTLDENKKAIASLYEIEKKKTLAERHEVSDEVLLELKKIETLLKDLLKAEKPNFFRIGYYTYKNPTDDLTSLPIKEANEKALKFLDTDFMIEFIHYEEKAIENSYRKALQGKKEALVALANLKKYFQTTKLEKAKMASVLNPMRDIIKKSIDPLVTIKDSIAYTFFSSLVASVKKYFYNETNNAKEEIRFKKQTEKRDALIASGKTIDWKVVPMKYVELEDSIQDMVSHIERLENKYKADIAVEATVDFAAMSVQLVDYFKEKASKVVYKITKVVAKEIAIRLMEEVGIPEPRIRYNQYPFEFSGGMRQRIVIAIALAANPDILICDEPTTALDVTIQSQILELINKLKKERNLSIIFITHDLGVVANMADRIAVMYAGKIVEYGESEEIFYAPAHPYTWALLSSMPDLETKEKLEAIPGTPPNMIYPPVGDAFAARNKYAMEIDFEKQPPLFKISDTHYAATWLLHPNAPKVEMPKIITERIKKMKETGGVKDGQ